MHLCLGTLEHGDISQAGPGLDQLSPTLATAQDSLVTPTINELEVVHPAGIVRERGRAGQTEEEDDLRGVSILNNLLMGQFLILDARWLELSSLISFHVGPKGILAGS